MRRIAVVQLLVDFRVTLKLQNAPTVVRDYKAVQNSETRGEVKKSCAIAPGAQEGQPALHGSVPRRYQRETVRSED
jgi:hypothetical protein